MEEERDRKREEELARQYRRRRDRKRGEMLARQYRRRSETRNLRRSWLDRIGGGKGHE